MSSGTRAFGTLLRYVPVDDAATTVGEVTGFGPPEVTADTIDMTSHQSTDRYREFIQGLRDGGEVTITANAVPSDSGQAAIISHFDASDESKLMELGFPDDSSWHFSALCTGVQPVTAAEIDGKLEFAATFKITGDPDWGASQAGGLTTDFFTLSEGDGTLDPEPAADEYTYTANVANGVSSLTVTPVSTSADTLYVQGTEVATGEASDSISLDVGENVIVIIAEQDGYTRARYEITVTRAAA